MAKKRGFFAQLQYQGQVAQRQRQQAANATARASAMAARQAEQAQLTADRARDRLARSTVAEQKSAEQEAQRLHHEAMAAEAASKNAQLHSVHDEIDSMLRASLALDHFVDLERLRTVAEHPPFTRADLEVPTPPPPPIVAREEPRYVAPEAPRSMFGGKKKHGELVAQVRTAYAQDHACWEAEIAQLPAAQLRQMQEHQNAEQQRVAWVNQLRLAYQVECDQREAETAGANASLDALIAGLQTGVEESIQEYVGIVLSNSVYPESLPVEHDFTFDSTLKELSLDVTVPPPSSFPIEKEFKYVKSKGEVTATTLAQKERKERYANAIYQVALRTLHEVFEADHDGRIQTIALTVGTSSLDPATGLSGLTPLIAVAAERSRFVSFDLSNVVPLATLHHLGALVSKNPFDLVTIDTSKGVRAS